jgi:hypothetical protein
MQVVGVILAMAAAAVVATLLEAAVLEVTVSFLRVAVSPLQMAVIHQTVEAIHREVEGIRLEVAVTPCSKRSDSPAPVGLEYLYRRAKRDMMSALRQTLLISQRLPLALNRGQSRQSLEFQIDVASEKYIIASMGSADSEFPTLSFSHPERQS